MDFIDPTVGEIYNFRNSKMLHKEKQNKTEVTTQHAEINKQNFIHLEVERIQAIFSSYVKSGLNKKRKKKKHTQRKNTHTHVCVHRPHGHTRTCLGVLSCGTLMVAAPPPAADDSRMIMNMTERQPHARSVSLSRSSPSPSLTGSLARPSLFELCGFFFIYLSIYDSKSSNWPVRFERQISVRGG